MLIGREKSVWTVFDELVTINKKVLYYLDTAYIQEDEYWNERSRPNFVHISDNSALISTEQRQEI